MTRLDSDQMGIIRRLPRNRSKGRRVFLSALAGIAVLGMGVFGTGCETDAQTGSLIGAGIGALAGQAIGRDTTGTLVGTAIGAGAGYAVGNESDKSKDRHRRHDDW